MRSGRPKEYKNRVMFTTTVEGDVLQRFRNVTLRDGKNINTILEDFMKQFLKIHESGNEQYTLDDPVMAYPAFGRDYAVLEKYFMQVKDSEFNDLKFKLQEWNGLFKKRFGIGCGY